jgi:outer membrane protein
MERWYSWKEEDARSVLAELNFLSASTELTLRLARSVFDTLLAADNLQLAEAQHKTLIAQRREAENLRQAGVLTLTEVEDTRARELSAQAGALEAAYGLQLRRRELARIVGTLLPESPSLQTSWQLLPPVPNDLEHWLSRVRDANPKVVSATMSLQMAGYAQSKTRAAHFPTLDLIASTTRTQNPNNLTSLERSGGVSLRLTVPIYEGGRTDAVATRAVALKAQAREELESTRREAEIKAAEAFLGMANASAKSGALKQALVAAQTSLKGTTIGRQAGLRTHTEVLNAQQQVFAVQRDLSKERYNHALAALQLKALSGQLSDNDLALLDRFGPGSVNQAGHPPGLQ